MNVNDWNFVMIKEFFISNYQESCHQFEIKKSVNVNGITTSMQKGRNLGEI